MKIRYVELHPSQIFNKLAIENLTCWLNAPDWRGSWWEEETVNLRYQFADIWREEYDKVLPHFNKLEQSIRHEGIKSPVSLVSGPPRDQYLNNPTDEYVGYIPPNTDYNNLLMTQPFGGSRITVAEQLGLSRIPCIVYDFTNLFPDAPEVTVHNYRDWFASTYTWYNGLPQIRDHSMTNRNRHAQQHATKIAREKMNV